MTPVPSQSTTQGVTASSLVAGSPAFDPDCEVELGSSGLVRENSVSILKINLLPGDCHAYLKKGLYFSRLGCPKKVFSCPRTMQVLAREDGHSGSGGEWFQLQYHFHLLPGPRED